MAGPRTHDIWFRCERSSEGVYVDGVDGPFESSVVRHICDRSVKNPSPVHSVVLKRVGGVGADRQVEIGAPNNPDTIAAVVRGCLRACLEIDHRATIPKRKWWQWKLWILLAVMPQVGCVSAGYDQRLAAIEARLVVQGPDFAKALALKCMGEEIALSVYLAAYPRMRSEERIEFLTALELSACSPEAVAYRRVREGKSSPNPPAARPTPTPSASPSPEVKK